MTDTTASAGKVPWHLWLVGVVAVLWNGFGAYDYLMTHLQGDAYLSTMMTEAQIASFHAMPAWMTGVWAIGVWGGLLGAVLLLLRRRLAFPVFVVSLAAFVLSLVYHYGMSDAGALMGPNGTIMNAVILAGCLFFVWYSRRVAQQGLLR